MSKTLFALSLGFLGLIHATHSGFVGNFIQMPTTSALVTVPKVPK